MVESKESDKSNTRVTGDTLLDAVVPAVADKLAMGWNLIVGGTTDETGKTTPNVALPEKAEREAIARNFITTKKLKIGDKTYLDMDNQRDKDIITNLVPEISALEAFGDTEKRTKLAGAIDKGVQESSGWWSKIVSFISGFFSWMMSGFKGGIAGMWECIGKKGGERACEAVNKSVNAAMAADPSLAAFKPYMGMLNEGIKDKAMEISTGKPVVKPPAAPIVPLSLDPKAMRERVTTGIRGTIDEAAANPDLGEKLKTLFRGGNLTGPDAANADKRAAELKSSLGDFVVNFSTNQATSLDKPSAGMSDEDFRGAMRAQLVDHFKKLHVTGNDSNPVALTTWYAQNWDGSNKKLAADAADLYEQAKAAPLDTALGVGASLWSKAKAKISGDAPPPPPPKPAGNSTLPDNAAQLPEFLADKVMGTLSGTDIANLHAIRNMAEKDFKDVDLEQMKKLISPHAKGQTRAEQQVLAGYMPPKGYEQGAPYTPAAEPLIVERGPTV